MVFAVLVVFALGFTTGTVVDNQLDGKIGDKIVSHGVDAPGQNAKN